MEGSLSLGIGEILRIKDKKILIVDDDPTVRALLRRYLRDEGYEVFEAEDGQHALLAAKVHGPDLILLDIDMPGMDGIQTCKLIRRNLNAKVNVPVIMVTGHASKNAVINAVNSGALGYVIKPFTKEEVLEKVQAVLEHQQRRYYR